MKHFLFCSLIACTTSVMAQQTAWPVFRHYEGNYVNRIAMPVGGIGTGTISLGGNGQWKDVEVLNRPGKGFYGAGTPKQAPCFLIYTEDQKGKKVSRALMGPIPISEYPGAEGSMAPNHGLPRFASSTFDTGYPFGIVGLEDPSMPVSAKVKVFNPFIPGDPDASGLPVAIIRYEIKNKTDKPLIIAVAGTMDNFVGMDGSNYFLSDFNKAVIMLGANKNKNTFRKENNLAGIFMTSDSVDRNHDTWGTIALTTESTNDATISYRTELSPKGWNANITDMWDDFTDDGMFRNITFDEKSDSPRAGLSVKTTLAPNETREIQFLLTWHFPNRKDWHFKSKTILGNYYTNGFTDAWDASGKILPRIPALERKTIEFVSLIRDSSYPDLVKEAALFNTSTLRTQTVFRTKDGNFFGWEGIFNSLGSCHGNCTHVWNYEQASPFLFGAMAMKMREIEYHFGLNDSTGLMSFRVSLPLTKDNSWKLAAADGQMGTIMKVYREWQLSGDDKFLRDVWPGVKKALAFAWIKNGWDADKDGVMEGCQHNTMDIEYYGPNPEVEFWYLGALKAAAAMAGYLKDKEFEATCKRLFESGSKWTDENLFNGEFYIHKIMPVKDKKDIAPGLFIGMGSKDLSNPDFQIGEGCLIDQLVGQNLAHVTGLGYLAKPANVRKALQSVAKYNYVSSFGEHFNNMRSYALGSEAGLSVTAYPDPSKRPEVPLSYFAEAWSGLEYTAASGMIYEGLQEEALKTMKDVRDRYDGLKRNPFDEEECGHHYARAMASWSTLLAMSKFNYSAVIGSFSITSVPGNYFWSNGYSWGNAVVTQEGVNTKVVLAVHFGNLKLSSVEAKGVGKSVLKKPVVMKDGQKLEFIIKK